MAEAVIFEFGSTMLRIFSFASSLPNGHIRCYINVLCLVHHGLHYIVITLFLLICSGRLNTVE